MLQGEYLGMRLTIEEVDKENGRTFLLCPGRLPSATGAEIGAATLPPDHDLPVDAGPGV